MKLAKRTRSYLATLLLAVSLISTADARVITVDDDATADFDNIQAAIDDANDGDTVEVQPGTYTGYGNRGILIFSKSVTVTGTDPNDPHIVASTIIDCGGTGNATYTGFIVSVYGRGSGGCDANSGCDCILAGLTITNAADGAVLCIAPNCTIKDCTLTNNSNDDGGAISCYSGSPTIANCTITGNSADYGAAIYCSRSNPTIANCRITGNSADYDGAVYCYQSNPVITNCTIIGNSAGLGGAIYCHESDAVVVNCTINSNKALPFPRGGCLGGAIYCAVGRMEIANCTFARNSASRLGGTIYSSSSDTRIANCTFAGNSTSDLGGAIYNSSSEMTITNCTFAGNSADQGGAIAGYLSASMVSNSIFWSNKLSDIDTSDNTPLIAYCNILDGFGGIGNINVNPLFADSGYWDVNGTPSDVEDDFWVDGDYHLKSEGWRWDTQREVWTWDDITSRCIDAGDPNSQMGDELTAIPDDPDNQ